LPGTSRLADRRASSAHSASSQPIRSCCRWP
jgi:hypothetical protein